MDDPRGPNAIEKPKILERGQPNIIDYSSKEPLLFQAGENSSHEYPGKIVTSNEPIRDIDREVKHDTTGHGTAETGKTQPLNDSTQSGLTTGAPQIELEEEFTKNISKNTPNHNSHGMNFNDKIDWKNKGIEINNPNEEINNSMDEETSQGVKPEEELLLHQIEQTTLQQNQSLETTGESSEDSLMHIPGEKSDTGDDHSRTGPEGNRPQDNNNATHYTGTSDSKINAATGIELEDPSKVKQTHNVDGTIPELREAIEIDTTPEKTKKKTLLTKLFPFLSVAGIITLSLPAFLKLMENQNYEQMDIFATQQITNLIDQEILKPEERLQIENNIAKSFPKLVPKKFKRFQYNSGKIECIICKPLDKMEFAEDDPGRPIVPSEKLGAGVYNTHTHCKCDNIPFEKLLPESVMPKSDVANSRAASKSLRERVDITKQYLRPLSESLIIEDKKPGEFDWIDDKAIEEMRKYSANHGSGKFILAVLSGESITDHRKDITVNENYRRRWNKRELMQNIRTAKGKMIDINHQYPKTDPQSGGVYDANWNFTTNRGEVIIWETDEIILNAIRNDTITAVSLHTGLPRKFTKNCSDGECFMEPEGTIIGELDNVALAFVVTKKEGFLYNGQVIPALPPGMSITKIYVIE